jgi:hypothetical protein
MRRDYPDSNAKELYANLERAGYSCKRIAKAKQRESGIPDAIVARRGDPYRLTHLLEVKRLGNRLSEAQVAFAREWPGCYHVATSSWEAEELLKECESRFRRKEIA